MTFQELDVGDIFTYKSDVLGTGVFMKITPVKSEENKEFNAVWLNDSKIRSKGYTCNFSNEVQVVKL